MSIQNIGTTIRLARREAGLTQEKLSEGICSVTMLSQVENGAIGLSASTFEALMTRAGKSVKAIPNFSNRTDFDCFYTLKRAALHLNSWQLQDAYKELALVETYHWANNKFHYSEWLLLHAKIQFYSGQCNHENNYHMLLHCLSITNPKLSILDFSSCLLSLNEIETLILIAHEALYTNRTTVCFDICSQIRHYIEQSQFSHIDKARLLAEVHIVLAKYHLAKQEYELALPIVETSRRQMAKFHIDMPLLQLTFLNGLCLYYQKRYDDAIHLMKVALYSAHGIRSCYTTICTQYIRDHLTDLSLSELFPLKDIPLLHFDEKKPITMRTLSSGTYDLNAPDNLSIGKLIRQLRTEQNVSQKQLCQGLCSEAKLSKIENNKQDADILLLEALLQRLGMSDRPFTFWGNEEEKNFHDIKFKAIHTEPFHLDDTKVYLQQLNEFTCANEALKKQFLGLFKSRFTDDAEEKLNIYFEALHCTLPQFDINRILEYRLSWTELSILNNIAHTYIYTSNPTKSFHYFNQLLSYYNTFATDALLRSNTYSITTNLYCHGLYNQKHYSNIVHFLGSSDSNIQCFPFRIQCSILFYYCQALGECKNFENAQLYGNYSAAMQYLMYLDKNAISLKRYLSEDFSISLNI